MGAQPLQDRQICIRCRPAPSQPAVLVVGDASVFFVVELLPLLRVAFGLAISPNRSRWGVGNQWPQSPPIDGRHRDNAIKQPEYTYSSKGGAYC